MNPRYVMGCIFIMLAGLMYTIERATSKIAGYLELSGFLAGGQTGAVPIPGTAGFFDNFFVPVFLIAGLFLLASKAKDKYK